MCHYIKRFLPNALNYPMLEEYDCRNDKVSNGFLFLCFLILSNFSGEASQIFCYGVQIVTLLISIISYFSIMLQVNLNLDVELKPQAQPRPYQDKSLSKMFGNGKSGYCLLKYVPSCSLL